MTIWKFPLKIADEQQIVMPRINNPLTVQVQNGIPCLWATVDESAPIVYVNVRIFGTGHEGVTPEMHYVGTFQVSGGALVFHVFIAGDGGQ